MSISLEKIFQGAKQKFMDNDFKDIDPQKAVLQLHEKYPDLIHGSPGYEKRVIMLLKGYRLLTNIDEDMKIIYEEAHKRSGIEMMIVDDAFLANGTPHYDKTIKAIYIPIVPDERLTLFWYYVDMYKEVYRGFENGKIAISVIMHCTHESIVRYFIKRDGDTYDYMKVYINSSGLIKKSKYINYGLSIRGVIGIYSDLRSRGYMKRDISDSDNHPNFSPNNKTLDIFGAGVASVIEAHNMRKRMKSTFIQQMFGSIPEDSTVPPSIMDKKTE